MIALEGRLTPADRAVSPYRLVPFELAGSPVAVRIRLGLDPAPGQETTVDLGLFGPGPTDFGSAAFRGWSGSERTEVWLAEDRATPGYRPGPLPVGRWHILLGLCRIPAAGCVYRLAVEPYDAAPASWPVDIMPRPAPLPPTTAGVAAGGATSGTERQPGPRRWYRGDLHCHTNHSDGADDPGTVVAAARRIGLDFVAITDHNTDSHHPWLAALDGPDFLVLRGEEITTYAGHANAWGLQRWVDFRPDVGPGIAGSITEVHSQGGLVSINHPRPDDPWLHDPDLPVDAVEVWNGPWTGTSPTHSNVTSLRWWADRLARGLRATAVGGSDMHSFRPEGQPIGTPVTWVQADALSRDGILDGIRAGRVVVTRDPIGPRPELRAASLVGRRASIGEELAVEPGAPLDVEWRVAGGRGMTVRLVSARGPEAVIYADSGDARRAIRLEPPAADRAGPTAFGHLRLEVVGPDGALTALTNPIHLVPGDR